MYSKNLFLVSLVFGILYSSNSFANCGLEGSIIDRVSDCHSQLPAELSELQSGSKTWNLVASSDGFGQVWIDVNQGVLWTTAMKKSTFGFSFWSNCNPKSKYFNAFISKLNMTTSFVVPSLEETKAAYLNGFNFSIFPLLNTSATSSRVWTQTSVGDIQTVTFDFANGEESISFDHDEEPLVRCIRKIEDWNEQL